MRKNKFGSRAKERYFAVLLKSAQFTIKTKKQKGKVLC